MERHIADNSKNGEVIFPYIGGEEVNSSPTHDHHRYVINFGERSEEECRQEWPELMAIVEKKVKPGRLEQNREIRARYWWRLGEATPALFAAIAGCERMLVTCIHTPQFSLAVLPSSSVFSHVLIVFSLSDRFLGFLRSTPHETFAGF
jgi:hypothetical protein